MQKKKNDPRRSMLTDMVTFSFVGAEGFFAEQSGQPNQSLSSKD